MRRTKSALLALAMVASLSSPCWADTQQPNPYLSVVDRNPFGLKPPPPPPPETPPQPVVPLAKVVLTGITSVFGPPRAFVEITEQEPGKTPNVRRPIMCQGDREGSIEIISIDVANTSIRIKNGGIETNVVFEVAKTSTGPAPGLGAPPTALSMGTPQPGHPGAAASASAPTIVSSGGAAPAGRAGTAVSLFGGTSPAPNAAYPAYASAANTYASAYSPAGSTANNLGAGISTYGAGMNVARPLRTDTSQPPQLTREETHQAIEAARPVLNEFNRAHNIPPIPLPPTMYSQPAQHTATGAH